MGKQACLGRLAVPGGHRSRHLEIVEQHISWLACAKGSIPHGLPSSRVSSKQPQRQAVPAHLSSGGGPRPPRLHHVYTGRRCHKQRGRYMCARSRERHDAFGSHHSRLSGMCWPRCNVPVAGTLQRHTQQLPHLGDGGSQVAVHYPNECSSIQPQETTTHKRAPTLVMGRSSSRIQLRVPITADKPGV